MEAPEALRILEALADGIDSHTGEIFPIDSPYQNPQIIRALFVAIRALERLEVRPVRPKHLPENAGKPWDDSELTNLIESFDAGVEIKQLAQRHGRTEGAIVSRLERLGKVVRPHVVGSV